MARPPRWIAVGDRSYSTGFVARLARERIFCGASVIIMSRDKGRIDPTFKTNATLVRLNSGFIQWRGEPS